MPVRRRVLTTALVVVPVLAAVSATAVAHAAPQQRPAASSSSGLDLQAVRLGVLSSADTEFKVRITEPGTYKIQFGTHHPAGGATVVFDAAVDGRPLAAATWVTPPGSRLFVGWVYSEDIQLDAGEHCFVLRASGARTAVDAVLVDSDFPE